jgi:hypothetical protein
MKLNWPPLASVAEVSTTVSARSKSFSWRSVETSMGEARRKTPRPRRSLQ